MSGRSEHNHGAKSCCCASKTAKSCCGNGGKRKILSEKAALWISFFALIASFSISFFEWHFPFYPLSDPSWIAVILCGFPIFTAAYKSLVYEKNITSSLLISIAMLASLSLQVLMFTGFVGDSHSQGYIFAAGEIAFLMGLGEAIEGHTVAKARAGVESLARLAPQTALKKVGADFTETEISEIEIGDIVLVKPNSMISVDGILVEGRGAVDQSSMTGESLPVDKYEGDAVLAGTWNKSNSMLVRVRKKSEDTSIAKLVRLVEEAEGKRAPISRIANKWAAMIVPSAILSACVIFLFAYFVLNVSAIAAIERAVTILVVFCPCAFALATPTAIAAALGNSARKGILIKSGAAFEELSRVNYMVFDKTGTLTKANLRVKSINTFGLSDDELVALAASAESHSDHPIAKALLDFAKDKIALSEPKNMRSLVGIGIECEIENKKIKILSFDALQKSGTDFSFALRAIKERLNMGETLVCVLVDERLKGVISLSDELRSEIPKVIKSLDEQNCQSAIFTGDNELAAKHIAKLSGIKNVHHSLMPADKAKKINEIKKQHKVCMMGDGVNDAPALAKANVSVAMAAFGSDLAIETADIALLNDKVSLIPRLLLFAKKTMRTIKMNFAVSLGISFLAIILSAYGFLTPVSGALVHNLSSIIVLLNSANLLRWKF